MGYLVLQLVHVGTHYVCELRYTVFIQVCPLYNHCDTLRGRGGAL